MKLAKRIENYYHRREVQRYFNGFFIALYTHRVLVPHNQFSSRLRCARTISDSAKRDRDRSGQGWLGGSQLIRDNESMARRLRRQTSIFERRVARKLNRNIFAKRFNGSWENGPFKNVWSESTIVASAKPNRV